MNSTDLLIKCMRKTKTESLVSISNKANPVKKTESATKLLYNFLEDRLMSDDYDRLLARES